MAVDLAYVHDRADAELVPPFGEPLLRDEAGASDDVEMGKTALVELPDADVLEGSESSLDSGGEGTPGFADSLDSLARRGEPFRVTREGEKLVGLTSSYDVAPLRDFYWPTDRTLP